MEWSSLPKALHWNLWKIGLTTSKNEILSTKIYNFIALLKSLYGNFGIGENTSLIRYGGILTWKSTMMNDNKETMLFCRLKILIVIFTTTLVFICNGQENINNAGNKVLQAKVSIQDSALKKNQSKEQISQVVRMMFQDSKRNIWFGTQSGLFKQNNNSMVRIDGIKSESGKGVTIKDIAEDRDGKIWIGHEGGISSIDGEVVTNYYESDGLISDDVWTIETAVNGDVWIGTIEGVCFFNGQEFIKFELPEGEIDTTLGVSSTKMVHCIMEDGKGSIWFSTNAGLFKLTDGILTNVSEKFSIQTNFINGTFESRNNEIWVASKEALYKISENKIENITNELSEIGKGIGSVAEDKNGNIWFVSNQHSLYTYNGQYLEEFQKSQDNQGPVVFQIFKDDKDRLWFVGFGGAYRLEKGKFINITKDGPW